MDSLRLESPLLRDAGFAHGFSLRAVDLAFDAEDRAASLARFAAAAGVDPARIRECEQVHGGDVAFAEEVALAPPRTKADALVSTGSLAVGVRVADCVPILIGDEASGAAVAVHAGWKGFVAGVLSHAVAALRGRVGPSGRLVCAIGPAIGPCCFEVGLDVARAIGGAAGVDLVARTAGDRAYVNLRRGVRAELARLASVPGAGPVVMEEVGGCTRCDAERYFSFRRGGERGRMLGVIAPRSAP